jgi:hypothetical protein
VVNKGFFQLLKGFDQRRRQLIERKNLQPSWTELFMGFICLGCAVANVLFKIESKTLVFMLNPCHASNFFLIYLCFTPFHLAGELVAFCLFGFSFGGLLGIVFNENEGLPKSEIIVYNI